MESQSGRDKDIMNVYDPQSFERRVSSHEKGLKIQARTLIRT